MSLHQTDEVELSTLAGIHTDYEYVVKKLNDLKAEFLSLQNLIKHNIRLCAEHEDLLADRANEISSDYSHQVMIKFGCLCLCYEDVKRKLKHHLSAQTIKHIEDSVIDAIQDDYTYSTLLFFPEFQARHETATARYAETLQQIKHYNNQDVWIDNVNYAERAKSYRTWYLYTGVLSIIGIGLPLLLGGLITHVIDKLMLKLNDRSNQKANLQIDKKLQLNLNPALPDLQNNISMNTENLLRQGFFSLAKQRYVKEIREVEVIKSKLPDPFV